MPNRQKFIGNAEALSQLPRRLASRLGRGFDSCESPLMGGYRGHPIHHGWLTAP